MYHKVIDDPDLVRDNNSQGIINTNKDELLKYRQRRNKEQMLNVVIKEHQDLKNEISDIKNLLMKLLEKNN